MTGGPSRNRVLGGDRRGRGAGPGSLSGWPKMDEFALSEQRGTRVGVGPEGVRTRPPRSRVSGPGPTDGVSGPGAGAGPAGSGAAGRQTARGLRRPGGGRSRERAGGRRSHVRRVPGRRVVACAPRRPRTTWQKPWQPAAYGGGTTRWSRPPQGTEAAKSLRTPGSAAAPQRRTARSAGRQGGGHGHQYGGPGRSTGRDRTKEAEAPGFEPGRGVEAPNRISSAAP